MLSCNVSGGAAVRSAAAVVYTSGQQGKVLGVYADGSDARVGTLRQAGRARGKGGWGGAQEGAGTTLGKQDQTQA